MTRIRRRSWPSSRQTRRDNWRLSTMIGLLAVVLVLMFAASRPEIWVHLVPNLDQPAPATAEPANKTAPTAGPPPAGWPGS